MTDTTWSVQDAKNSFSAVVEAAQDEPQTVTKHGRPAAVVMSTKEYDRLRSLERLKSGSFVDHLLAMPTDDGEFDRLNGDLRDVQF